MSELFDLDKFYEEDDLSSMKLSDKISMSLIYDKIKKGDFSLDDENIKIIKTSELIYSIKYYYKILLSIHESTIEIKFEIKKELNPKIYNVINGTHLSQIIDKLNITVPKIKCQTCNLILDCNYLFLIKHKIYQLLILDIYEFD